jgi:RHS repeat-associated protein
VWNRDGTLSEVDEPVPALAETYGVDARGRRYSRMLGGVVQEYYAYEGQDRVAVVGRNGADAIGFGIAGPVLESYLFDGIDHPLRINRSGTNSYYELDLAGNVRGLRASGGASLGGYRYSAFGQTLEDTSSITQPLRWKGRWFSPVAGGTYDVRARQWSPELGVFLSVDEFAWFSETTTLWGWPRMNPVRFDDIFGRGGGSPGPAPAPGGDGGSCSQTPKPCDKGPVACHFKCDSDYLKAFQKCQGRGGSSTPQSVPSIPTPPKTRAECEAEAEEAQEQCNEKCKTDCRE